jgi:hypothetical protein
VDLPVPSDSWFSLSIDNAVIENFGDPSAEGGAVRLNNFKSNQQLKMLSPNASTFFHLLSRLWEKISRHRKLQLRLLLSLMIIK